MSACWQSALLYQQVDVDRALEHRRSWEGAAAELRHVSEVQMEEDSLAQPSMAAVTTVSQTFCALQLLHEPAPPVYRIITIV